MGFAEAVVDGKMPILGFALDLYHNINIVRKEKITKWFNFVNDSIVSVFLLQHNKIFAVYITTSPLLFVDNDASEKIIPFAIYSDNI